MSCSTQQREDRSHCLILAHVMPVGKLSMFRNEGGSGGRTQEEEKRSDGYFSAGVSDKSRTTRGQETRGEIIEYRGGKRWDNDVEKNGVLERNGEEIREKIKPHNRIKHPSRRRNGGENARTMRNLMLYGVHGSSKVRQGPVRLGGRFRTHSCKVSKASSSWSCHIRRTRG